MGSLCYMMGATLCSAFPDSFIADLLPVGTILHWLLPPRSIFFLCGSRCTRLASLRIGPFNPSKQGAAAQSMLATRNNCRLGGEVPLALPEIDGILCHRHQAVAIMHSAINRFCSSTLPIMGESLNLERMRMRRCLSVLSRGRADHGVQLAREKKPTVEGC